jgi:hypothetical protein
MRDGKVIDDYPVEDRMNGAERVKELRKKAEEEVA